MIFAGVGWGVYSDKPSCCSSDSNSYIEEGSESASHLRLNCKKKKTHKKRSLNQPSVVIHHTCDLLDETHSPLFAVFMALKVKVSDYIHTLVTLYF